MSERLPQRAARKHESTVGDQAAGLRSLLKRRVLRLLPVQGDFDTHGQGACAAQIAMGLARCGRNVILLDAVGAALAALGKRTNADLRLLIEGERDFADVAVRCAPGLRAIAAQEGLPALLAADAANNDFFAGFLRLDDPADLIVVNLPATLPPTGRRWLPLLGDDAETLLVMGTGERSLTAAYAAIKQASAPPRASAFRVLVNGAGGEREARAACRQLADTARRFLGATVGYCGNLQRNTRGQIYSGAAAPHAEATRTFTRIAAEAQGWRLAECMLDPSNAIQTH